LWKTCGKILLKEKMGITPFFEELCPQFIKMFLTGYLSFFPTGEY
jgi:hypothetical protein